MFLGYHLKMINIHTLDTSRYNLSDIACMVVCPGAAYGFFGLCFVCLYIIYALIRDNYTPSIWDIAVYITAFGLCCFPFILLFSCIVCINFLVCFKGLVFCLSNLSCIIPTRGDRYLFSIKETLGIKKNKSLYEVTVG